MDLILYLKLGDILAEEDSLDNILITLPKCQHVFTVETLDGICCLEEYYTKNNNGNWFHLTSPQHAGEIRKPPMCPTCRAAITSPRYGRVFKSANLDILERNVISHMSARMTAVQSSLNTTNKEEIRNKLATAAGNVKPDAVDEKQKKGLDRARKATVEQKSLRPISVEDIKPQNRKLFSIAPRVSNVWNQLTRHLVKAYKDATTICNIRSAHINAWQAAFSFLHEQEMNRAVSDPRGAPTRLAEHAMRVARLSVGIPQPRADKRFLVEAIWLTVQIRFTLAELAQTWIKAVGDSKNYALPERVEWGKFGLFLLKTCERDIQIAYEVAEDSESRRQMTKSQLLRLRVHLEKCRFNIDMTRQCGLWDLEQRRKYGKEASKEGDNCEQIIRETRVGHKNALPKDYPAWIKDNFLEAANAIKEEWKNLEQSLNNDTFYEPLSLDEKMAIIKAFDFCMSLRFVQLAQANAA